jgi:diketogulonate reductase-like aldo/keto reductase
VIREGKLKREELFLVTKIWMDEVDDVEAACRRSLDRLKLDYIDLYLLHFPIAVKRQKAPTATEGPV